jgi:hypothetical protein
MDAAAASDCWKVLDLGNTDGASGRETQERTEPVMSAQRASFLFPREASAALASIREHADVKQDADAIRLALSAFDSLLELVELSCRLFVRDREGRDWPYSPYRRFSYPGLEDALQQLPARDDDGQSPSEQPKNFFFSGPAVERLKAIRARSVVPTNADAIRLALTKFDQLLKVEDVGDSIVVRDLEGRESLFNLFNPQARRQLCNRARSSETSPTI